MRGRRRGHTSLKWVAESTFRTGCMSASRTMTAISLPEYLPLAPRPLDARVDDKSAHPSVSSARCWKS